MCDQCSCAADAEVSEEHLLEHLDGVLEEYRGKPGALIPVLQTVQTMFGYLPQSALRRIATALGKPYSEVAGVVGFYSFFSTVPRGKYLVRVCLGTACYVRGGKQVLDAVKKHLGIDVGQNNAATASFRSRWAAASAPAGWPPVVMVNDDVHQRVKPARINELLKGYRAKEHADAEKKK